MRLEAEFTPSEVADAIDCFAQTVTDLKLTRETNAWSDIEPPTSLTRRHTMSVRSGTTVLNTTTTVIECLLAFPLQHGSPD